MANNISFGNSSDITGNFGTYEIIEQKTETISHSSAGNYVKTITMSENIQDYIDNSLVIGYNIRGDFTFLLNVITPNNYIGLYFYHNQILNGEVAFNSQLFYFSDFFQGDYGIRKFSINYSFFVNFGTRQELSGKTAYNDVFCLNLYNYDLQFFSNRENYFSFEVIDNGKNASQVSFPVTITVFKQNIR